MNPAAPSDEDALILGTQLGNYVIEGPLGRGGFAITYAAHHARLTNQRVAIKEFFPERLARRSGLQVQVRSGAAEFGDGRRQFLEEGQRLACVRHPGVVRVIDFLEANGTAYLVMDLEPGHTLEALLAQRHTWPESEVIRLADGLLSALSAVHEAQLLHRDINPSNIIIRPGGDPVLIDFGAARNDLAQRTRTVTSVVTDGYSPSEQYTSDGRTQGPWTDIYALGATLYHVVSGTRPVAAPNRTLALSEGEADPLVPAREMPRGRYDERLLSAIDRMLAVRRQQRPQTIAEVKDLLQPIPMAEFRSPSSTPVHSIPNSDDLARLAPPPTGTAATARQVDVSQRETASAAGKKGRRRAGDKIPAALAALLVLGAGYGLYEWRVGQLASAEEAARKAEENWLAEEKREADERRMQEEANQAEARLAEERRKLEVARRADEARKAEEIWLAEEKRKADEMRKQEEAQEAEIARLAEQKHNADEWRNLIMRDLELGMTPQQVNQRLDFPFGSVEDLPVAEEFDSTRVTYFFKSFVEQPGFKTFSCQDPNSYVTFLFDRNGLARISLRYLCTCPCGDQILQYYASHLRASIRTDVRSLVVGVGSESDSYFQVRRGAETVIGMRTAYATVVNVSRADLPLAKGER